MDSGQREDVMGAGQRQDEVGAGQREDEGGAGQSEDEMGAEREIDIGPQPDYMDTARSDADYAELPTSDRDPGSSRASITSNPQISTLNPESSARISKLEEEMSALKKENCQVLEVLHQVLNNQIQMKEMMGHNISAQSRAQSSTSLITPQKSHSEIEEEYRKSNASHCRSVEDIKLHLPVFKNHYPDAESEVPDGISCKLCASPRPQRSGGHEGKVDGVLHYKLNSTSFPKPTKLPSEFKTLREGAVDHVSSKGHLQKKKVNTDEEEYKRKTAPKYYERGMRLGRLAYKSIHTNASQQSYELECAFSSANGLDIGDLNHSRQFAADMTPYFYNIIRSELRLQSESKLDGTGRRSPYSLSYDKYTTNRHTLGIVGVNMYNGSGITTFFGAAKEVSNTGHSAKGVAHHIMEAAESVLGPVENWRNNYVGSTADGAVIHLNYQNTLHNLVNQNQDAGQFYSVSHDYGHVLELAAADAKHHPACSWVEQRESQISNLHKRHGYGKSLYPLIETAQAGGYDYRTPILPSATRWATYDLGVLDAYISNYSAMYAKLMDERDNDLDDMMHVKAIVETTGAADIMEQVSKCSRTLQLPDIYPWQAEEVISKYTRNLQSISDGLADDTISGENLNSVIDPDFRQNSKNRKYTGQLIRRTSEALSEIEKYHTYQGNAIMNRQQRRVANSTRAFAQSQLGDNNQEIDTASIIQSSRKQVSLYANWMRRKIDKRFNSTKESINTEAAELFSMKSILLRERTSVPSSLHSYADKARKSGFISDEVDLDDLADQYSQFACDIHDAMNDKFQTLSISQRRETEKTYYNGLIFGTPEPKPYKDVNHLLAGSTMRLSNESQVEAMGSVIKQHSRGRPNLGVDNLSNESFISWNGPRPTVQANKLVEYLLKKAYGSDPSEWNLSRRTERKDKIHYYTTSKVVDRINTESEGRLSFKQRDFVEYENLLHELGSKRCEAVRKKNKNEEMAQEKAEKREQRIQLRNEHLDEHPDPEASSVMYREEDVAGTSRPPRIQNEERFSPILVDDEVDDRDSVATRSSASMPRLRPMVIYSDEEEHEENEKSCPSMDYYGDEDYYRDEVELRINLDM
ncbi:uncharacterized protein LOC118436696 [Folsomia candida]|uniref:uncharacterized protein LOC118436696 n=1 Tax=Folsomia candida TaxID=158441 RepID=UPI001604BED9|nr:uncharacterized protein LOC118436696 [Folsomia candida]